MAPAFLGCGPIHKWQAAGDGDQPRPARPRVVTVYSYLRKRSPRLRGDTREVLLHPIRVDTTDRL